MKPLYCMSDGGKMLNSYFIPVSSIVKTITLRCRGRPDALRSSTVPRGNSLTLLQTGMK